MSEDSLELVRRPPAIAAPDPAGLDGGSLPGPTTRLTQTDAFFIALQEQCGVRMHFGVALTVRGAVGRTELEAATRALVGCWPRLGQTARVGWLGLSWSGDVRVNDMVKLGEGSEALVRFARDPIDPFRAPPFQILWVPDGERGTLAFRCHHAAADGTAFFSLCVELVLALARARAGDELIGGTIAALPAWRMAPVRGRFGAMWRYMRHLARASREKRAARLLPRASGVVDNAGDKSASRLVDPGERPLARLGPQTPGPAGEVAVATLRVGAPDERRLRERARAAGVSPPWLCAAAWMRAIDAWNRRQGERDNHRISLEVPVSTAAGRRDRATPVGNPISALLVEADAREPIDRLARALRAQFVAAVRSGGHLGVPYFTAPLRYLPWAIYRRIAVSDTSTGFATSHFTWLDHRRDVGAEVRRLSRGALDLEAIEAYTPVCLEMGAALSAVSWPPGLVLGISHRLAALDPAGAREMLALLAAELEVG